MNDLMSKEKDFPANPRTAPKITANNINTIDLFFKKKSFILRTRYILILRHMKNYIYFKYIFGYIEK